MHLAALQRKRDAVKQTWQAARRQGLTSRAVRETVEADLSVPAKVADAKRPSRQQLEEEAEAMAEATRLKRNEEARRRHAKAQRKKQFQAARERIADNIKRMGNLSDRPQVTDPAAWRHATSVHLKQATQTANCQGHRGHGASRSSKKPATYPGTAQIRRAGPEEPYRMLDEDGSLECSDDEPETEIDSLLDQLGELFTAQEEIIYSNPGVNRKICQGLAMLAAAGAKVREKDQQRKRQKKAVGTRNLIPWRSTGQTAENNSEGRRRYT